MTPKLIIFDFDGTLGDTRQNIIITMQRTMRMLGLPVMGDAECASTIGLTLENSFKSLYPDMSAEMALRCVDAYRDIFMESVEELIPQLFPGVADTLARLDKMGIKMSVASSRQSQSLLLFLERMGVSRYFPYVLGADNVSKHKPDPEPVLKTLRELNYSPSDALVVGDMPVDVAMAHGSDVRAIAVTFGNATREELVESNADYIIDDFTKILEIVETL
ncbi:MAG: HAD family hydrolase [Alistipes sp.]|nr:HAD family hydrolase [Alistipes sp.]MBO7262943.1 HAD family hydrolase [Alistipes sp.]